MYVYNKWSARARTGSSGGNTSSNPQVSALIPRPVFNGMERMCQRHGSNQNSHPPVLIRKQLCNQFIHYHISIRGVFGINHIKLRNLLVKYFVRIYKFHKYLSFWWPRYLWWHFRQCLRQNLATWQRSVQPVTKMSSKWPQIAKFMGPTWNPPGSCRPQMGPMLTPWTLLSGTFPCQWPSDELRC